MIKTTCSYNRDRMQNKCFSSQQSKPKQNKLKITIFTAMLLMQYFCLHNILSFSKSYPELESKWPTAKCRGRKSFDTGYYIVTCAMLCISFSSKLKATNVFPKHSEIESTWPINSSKEEIALSRDSKELFVQLFMKVFDQNWIHGEVWSQRTGTLADFNVPW